MVSHVYSKSQISSSAALAAQARQVLWGRLLPALATPSPSPSPSPLGGVGVDVHSLFAAAAADLVTAYCFGAARASDLVLLGGAGAGAGEGDSSSRSRARWQTLYATRKAHGFFAQEMPGVSRLLRRWLGIWLTPAFADAANAELEAWNRAMSDAAIDDLLNEGGDGGGGQRPRTTPSWCAPY